MSNQLFDDLIHSVKTESYHWPMYILFLCYFIGRFSSYTVIYLRLKQMLDNSIFSYEKKTYNKIFCMLIVTGTLGLLCIGAEVHESIYYGVLPLWIISDIIYFATVTFMYLSKLKEIKNTYEKSVSQIQISTTSTTPTHSHNSIDCAPEACVSTSTSPQKISTGIKTRNRYDHGHSSINNNEKAALELGNIVSIYTKLNISNIW